MGKEGYIQDQCKGIRSFNMPRLHLWVLKGSLLGSNARGPLLSPLLYRVACMTGGWQEHNWPSTRVSRYSVLSWLVQLPKNTQTNTLYYLWVLSPRAKYFLKPNVFSWTESRAGLANALRHTASLHANSYLYEQGFLRAKLQPWALTVIIFFSKIQMN